MYNINLFYVVVSIIKMTMNVLLMTMILTILGPVERMRSASTQMAASTASVLMVSDHQRRL